MAIKINPLLATISMKSKQQKTEELRELKNKLPKSNITIFTSFSRAGEKGLSVAQMTELKRLLRSLGSEYFVTKKTLIDLAIKYKNYDGLYIYAMKGSIGLVLGNDDPYRVAKSVYEFSTKNPALNFWGAIFRQGSEKQAKFIGVNEFLEVAKMPSREVLLSRLVGMLTYPIRGLAVAINEISKKRI